MKKPNSFPILKFSSNGILYDWLQAEAKKQKKPVSQLIRELLNHVRLTNQRSIYVEMEQLEQQIGELRSKLGSSFH